MIQLKEIIIHLNHDAYQSIENNLIENKADNFLLLLRSYKNGNLSDNEIAEKLSLTSNSLYVLKSRLYDKIQVYLVGGDSVKKEEILRQLQQIPEMCFSTQREIAISFLKKLEKDLLVFDMHNELLLVYGALKRIYLYSNDYFSYSQLYNKQIAFSLSLEKSTEALGNFNVILAQYHFSKTQLLYDKLLFLKNEITDHFNLNHSRQIEIIKNLVELQLSIFCSFDKKNELDTLSVLSNTKKLFEELPNSSPHKKWALTLDYLFFEYYLKTSQSKLAQEYYTKVNSDISTLLLYNSICNTPRFLISKIRFLQDAEKTQDLIQENKSEYYFDKEDMQSVVLLGIYNSMKAYYSGNFKTAISVLIEIVNMNSFKDLLHVDLEVKLTLAFFYLKISEMDLAENIIKSISRKIKTEKQGNYSNVTDIIKLFTIEILHGKDKKSISKQKDLFALFAARNSGEFEILHHLQTELKIKYTIA